jgi:streptomycin 6-kinase
MGTMTPRIPDETRAEILTWFGAEGQRWLDALPDTVAAVAAAWGFTPTETLTGGAVSFVTGGTLRDGREAVLKVAPLDEENRHEADALRVWAGRDAVRLLHHDAARNALLLERLRPGTALYDAGLGWEEEARIAAPLIARLAVEPPAGHPFRLLADDARSWPLDDELAALAERLIATAPARSVLVNRDLHALNILRDGDRWRMIDPKPLVGDPAFTAGAMLRDRRDELGGRPDYEALLRRRLELLCAGTGDDPWRVAAWAACYVAELEEPAIAASLLRVTASTSSTSPS